MADYTLSFISTPVPFFAGLVVAVLLGRLTGPVLDAVAVRGEDPPEFLAEVWDKLTGKLEGGGWIGLMDLVFFYLAIALGRYEIAAGWLAFKVASKWEAWSNIVRFPDHAPRRDQDVDFLVARRTWGARAYQRSVFGTGANFIWSMVGYGVGVLILIYCAL